MLHVVTWPLNVVTCNICNIQKKQTNEHQVLTSTTQR
jgi:hypothetical protein